MFLVFQTMLNLHLLFVNITSTLIRFFVNFSFDFENTSRRKITFADQMAILELYNHLYPY